MAKLSKIVQDLNWEVTKNEAYGNVLGYQVTLIQNISYGNSANNFKAIFIPFSTTSEENANELLAFTKEHKKALKLHTWEISTGMLSARLAEGFKGINAEDITNLLDLFLNKLKELGIEPLVNCVYCNLEDADSVTYINKIALPAHSACIQKAQEEQRALEEARKNQAVPFTAYLGAVIGAIAGIIPFTVVMWFGWLLGPLVIIAGYATYWGYSKFGGVVKSSTKYIISVITFLGVLFSNYMILAYVAFDVNTELGTNLTVMDIIAIPEIQGDIISSLGMTALFGLIGVFYVFSKIKQDEEVTDIK